MTSRRILVRPALVCAVGLAVVGSAGAATSSKPPCKGDATVTVLPQHAARATYAEAQTDRVEDVACAIDARTVLTNKDHPVLVDVRSPAAFRTAWIPGSVNLSVAALDSSALVQTARTVVLVDDGRGSADLMQRCGAMRKRGRTQMYVLTGGLVAWRHAGGAMAGSAAAFDRPVELDDAMLRQTLGDPLVSLVFAGVGAGSNLPGAHRRIVKAQTTAAPETVLAEVPKEVAVKHATVVFVARAADAERWRAAARSLEMPEPFFYEGEGTRYDAYIARESSIAAHAYEPLPSRCERI